MYEELNVYEAHHSTPTFLHGSARCLGVHGKVAHVSTVFLGKFPYHTGGTVRICDSSQTPHSL